MTNCIENHTEIDVLDLKRKLCEQMNSEWREHVLSKPKLRTYMKFKSEYCVEKIYVLNYT